MKRFQVWGLRALLVTAVSLSGCASLPDPGYESALPAALPQRVELVAVPFHPQQDYQCGPAALATVLGHAGVARTPEQLVAEVYLPQRQGSLQLEMLGATRRAGLLPYRLEGTPQALLAEPHEQTESGQIGQTVPVDRQRPDLNSYRIDIGMNQHASDCLASAQHFSCAQRMKPMSLLDRVNDVDSWSWRQVPAWHAHGVHRAVDRHVPWPCAWYIHWRLPMPTMQRPIQRATKSTTRPIVQQAQIRAASEPARYNPNPENT